MSPRNLLAPVVLATSLILGGCGPAAAPEGSWTTGTTATDAPVAGPADRVLAISVDGLGVAAVRQLGPAGLPHLHRLLDTGMSTLNARTSAEKTVTLPNHAGMMTGRRVRADLGGHGVNINGYSDTTVHALAGHDVSSIFRVASEAGLTTALYTGKDKFDLFESSWPESLGTFQVDADLPTLVTSVRDRLASDPADLTFLHMSAPDVAGHAHGFMSPRYLDAVRTVDAQLGRLLAVVDGDPALAEGLAVVLTADHGGPVNEKNHNSRSTAANYTIPFVAWGAGTATGDLYLRNPELANPGTAQRGYAGKQPVRNANLANLSMDLLGLPAVPGSGIDPAQQLDVD